MTYTFNFCDLTRFSNVLRYTLFCDTKVLTSLILHSVCIKIQFFYFFMIFTVDLAPPCGGWESKINKFYLLFLKNNKKNGDKRMAQVNDTIKPCRVVSAGKQPAALSA